MTTQELISIIQSKLVIQPWFEHTWKNVLRWIYGPNFMIICATVWEKSKMCLTNIVNWNRKYRSERPNLNLDPLGTSKIKYEWFLVIGFIEEDFFKNGQKLYKITHNSMQNRGRTLIWTKLGGVHPRNIHTKSEANPCTSLREDTCWKYVYWRSLMNKLKITSPGDSLMWMISGQWFYRKIFFQELANNCRKLPIIPWKIGVAPQFE